MKMPESVKDIDMHICIRYTDILDYESLSRDREGVWRYPTSQAEIENYQDQLTVSEILDYTPYPGSIASMEYRKFNSFIMHRSSGESDPIRPKEFDEKFLHLEFICYTIDYIIPPGTWELNYDQIINTPSDTGKIFKVVPKASFEKADILKIIIGPHFKPLSL